MKFLSKELSIWTLRRTLWLSMALFILPNSIFGKQMPGKMTTNATAKYVAPITIKSYAVCTNIAGFSTKQMRFCEKYRVILGSVIQGIALGIKECKFQFRKRRWNCTSLLSKPPLFKNHAVAGTKEDAFTHAIIAAGIAHSVARALGEGNITLPGEKVDTKSNIKNGMKIAKEFLDGQDVKDQDVALMNKHNIEVGLEVLNSSAEMECKCFGPSHACNIRTCWKQLPSFRAVGKVLHELYVKSVKVKSSQGQGSLVLQGVTPYTKPTRKTETVFIKESPNYCNRDVSRGILGTKGRACVKDLDDNEADVCDIMCCGRGYDTRIVMSKWQCHCKFYWCCFVKCKSCSEEAIMHTCK